MMRLPKLPTPGERLAEAVQVTSFALLWLWFLLVASLVVLFTKESRCLPS